MTLEIHPAPPQVGGLPWDGDTRLAGGPIVPSAVPTGGWDRTESLLSVVRVGPAVGISESLTALKGGGDLPRGVRWLLGPRFPTEECRPTQTGLEAELTWL